MITEWLIDLGLTIASWLLELFPTDKPAEWFTTVGTFVTDLLLSVAGLGAWVPWAIAIGVWATVTGLWVVGLTIKVLRWLLGLFPTMGGG